MVVFFFAISGLQRLHFYCSTGLIPCFGSRSRLGKFLISSDGTPLSTLATYVGSMVWDPSYNLLKSVAVRRVQHYLVFLIDFLDYVNQVLLVVHFTAWAGLTPIGRKKNDSFNLLLGW